MAGYVRRKRTILVKSGYEFNHRKAEEILNDVGVDWNARYGKGGSNLVLIEFDASLPLFEKICSVFDEKDELVIF